MKLLPRIKQPTEVYKVEYPNIEEVTNIQLTKCFWTANEIKVEKDIHDVLTNFSPSEKFATMEVLKLFTRYEVAAGSEYWTNRFIKMFPRHEFGSMGAAFGMMELCVHKTFYNKINELLNVDDDFYTNYKEDPVLVARMESIDSIINDDSDFVSLAAFSLVEGVILYSSFAFLKHFQSLGKNKLLNVVRGINYSCRDENLHAEASAKIFVEYVKQSKLSKDELEHIKNRIKVHSDTILEHEFHIIDTLFSKGEIKGITPEQLKQFVVHRLNHCLKLLKLDNIHYAEDKENDTIKKWFYEGINSYQFNDFFAGQGREYVRSWDEDSFVW